MSPSTAASHVVHALDCSAVEVRRLANRLPPAMLSGQRCGEASCALVDMRGDAVAQDRIETLTDKTTALSARAGRNSRRACRPR